MTAAIYLDNQSATPIDPRVADAVAPFLGERYGHPASRSHAFGWDAEAALEKARAQVAGLIGASASEIVFTSGGTEADNLAVKGTAEALESKGRHVITTAMENSPVREACAWLAGRGWEITVVPPDETGRIAPGHVAASLRPDTVLVSIQYANHEVGTLQSISEVGALCAERGVWLHTDATHAAAWMPIDVQAEGIHLLSLAAHRMYGPMGAGALYVRRRSPRIRLATQMHGGGHERGLRSGTPNLPGAAGLGKAAELCLEERGADSQRVGGLRDDLERRILDEVDGVTRLGAPLHRLPNNANLAFERVEGEALLLGLGGVAAATGSACSSATLEPSRVLRAMGVSPERANTSVRFSLGRFTTADEIATTAQRVVETVARIRALDPR